MSCKSCGHEKVKERKMCDVCLADYRYSAHRKSLERRQVKQGKPISQQWARKPRWDYFGELQKRGMA